MLGHRQGDRTARHAGTKIVEAHRVQRQTKHQPPAAPVGEVHVHDEVAGQQLGRVGLQTTPLVVVEEPCRVICARVEMLRSSAISAAVNGWSRATNSRTGLADDTPAPFAILTTNQPRPLRSTGR